MNIIVAQESDETARCFATMVQLRPQLLQDDFVAQVQRQQKIGYQLAYIEVDGEVVCVAGFRIAESLSWGMFMYVDDLITDDKQRSKGYGDKMLDWLIDYAKAQGCQQFHLDSGVQRYDAHRFYLRKRMNITAHHFAIELK